AVVSESSSGDGVFREGERNTRLTRIAGALVRQGVIGEALDAILGITNEEVCEPLLDEREVERIARSIERTDQRGERVTSEWIPTHTPQISGDKGRFKLFSINDVLNEP